MNQEKVSRRDGMMFMAGAMLSPLIGTIPRRTAKLGGTAGYLGILLGVLPLIAVALLLGWTFRRLGCTGLGNLYRKAFGGRWTAMLGLLNALWMFGMLMTCIQVGSERLVQAVYPETRDLLFGAVLILLVWRASWNSLAANARMGRIFFFLLATVLGVVMLLAVTKVKSWNLMPVWWQDLPGIGLAALPCAGLLGIPALAQWEEFPVPSHGRAHLAGWCLGFAGMLVLMGMICTGVFGAKLAARLELPFFSLAKECTDASRLESIVTATWVLSDVLFALFLLRGTVRALSCAVPRAGKENRWFLLAVLVLALAAATQIPSNFFLKDVLTPIWMGGSAVLGYLLPASACVVLRLRRQTG